MLKEIFFRQFEIFQIYKGLYGKPLQRNWVARVDFPIQILSNYRRPLRSLLLRYTTENLQFTLF